MLRHLLEKEIVILDRDGVINKDSLEYIKTPDEWVPIEGSLKAIAKLNAAGIKIAVATNQSGIGRGYYSHQVLRAIHDKLQHELKKHGGWVDKIVYCPHHPNDGCQCRKPQPGMLNAISDYFSKSLEGVPYFGDRITDIQCAKKVGAVPVLIQSAMTEINDIRNYDNLIKFESLEQAVNAIL